MSPSPASVCARCSGPMREGFLLDQAHYNTPSAAEWVEDLPVRSFWSGLKLKGKRRLPIQAFRCDRCGILELRAPSAS